MTEANKDPLPSDSQTPKENGDSSRLRQRLIKTGVIVLILLSGVLVLQLTPLRAALEDVNEAKARIDSFGVWGPIVFTVAVAMLAAVGVPRLLLCSLAGAVFGVREGLLYGQIGTITGCFTTFVFARWAAAGTIARYRSKLGPLAPIFESPGVFGIILIRQLPITTGIVNVVLGASSVRHRTFLVGTLFGFLPEAVPVTMFGAGVLKASPSQAITLIMVAGVMLLGVWIGASVVATKYKSKKLQQEQEKARQ